MTNNETNSSETALDTTASNERSRRQKLKYDVTFRLAEADLIMLKYALEQMLPGAYKRAYNGSVGFFVT
ncbi:hypothetical protein BGAL_0238g00090 [Botrytis galanthina]|uniref:Uncharacterized protein n=1 Tax=Botrytis galanthina TaxID=278940 RepID=A0A4S8QTX0_9HELO|nr:hypothetical protein BGAL_0238g00090 [Botrytis galanthina]